MDRTARRLALETQKTFFDRSTRTLGEADEAFAPVEGMFTTAQQLAHVAQTVDWFIEGAFSPDGFDLDFAAMRARTCAVTTWAEARRWWEEAMARALAKAESESDEAWAQPIAEGEIMGGAPRWTVIQGLADHTAHHRGALAVYARLRGYVPTMPYED